MGGAALRTIGLALTVSAALAAALPGAAAPDPLCDLGGKKFCGPSSPATTTEDIARDRSRRRFTAVDFHSIRAWGGKPIKTGGVVGVDVTLGDDDIPAYSACVNAEDPYHGACSPTGYTMVKNWYAGGRTNFGRGLIVGNSSNRATCAAPCRHYWGQRVVRIDVELYAKYPSGGTDVTWVRPRFAEFSNDFTSHANGGTYGPPIGTVELLRLGEPGTVSLDGVITRFGLPVREKEVSLRLFQQNWYGLSSGGHRLQSFATPNSTKEGTYTTGAMYSGRFFIRVIDKTLGTCREVRNVMVTTIGQRFDVELGNDGFGQGMTPC